MFYTDGYKKYMFVHSGLGSKRGHNITNIILFVLILKYHNYIVLLPSLIYCIHMLRITYYILHIYFSFPENVRYTKPTRENENRIHFKEALNKGNLL